MKRLLCVLSGMNAGGAETFLMKIYRQLDKTKYQMDFCINVKEKCFYEDEIICMGGRIYRIPSKSENLKEFKIQLTKVIKDNGYARVLRITSNAMGFMDLKIAKRAGAQICCARSSNASDGNSFKARICHDLGRVLYDKYVDVKLAPSDLAAKYTFGKNAYESGKVKILHNGVDLNAFKFYPDQRKKIRGEFSIGTKTKLIGHIGRFDDQKNHTFLLEVFKKIHMIDNNTKLLLVGGGKLEKMIREKTCELGICENVIFAGLRSDVPHLLSAMDVFVFPSLYEGMPNTIIEAQAIGLPCVIADTITKESNITGLVNYVPLGDSNVWAETALSAISPERVNTHNYFIEHQYDIKSVAEEFVKLIYVVS